MLWIFLALCISILATWFELRDKIWSIRPILDPTLITTLTPPLLWTLTPDQFRERIKEFENMEAVLIPEPQI